MLALGGYRTNLGACRPAHSRREEGILYFKHHLVCDSPEQVVREGQAMQDWACSVWDGGGRNVGIKICRGAIEGGKQ